MFLYYGANESEIESSTTLCLKEVRQVAISVGRQITTCTEFGRVLGRSLLHTIDLLYPPSERSELARYHVILFSFRPSVRLCTLSI